MFRGKEADEPAERRRGRGDQEKLTVGRDLDFADAVGEQEDDNVEGRQPGYACQWEGRGG